MTSTSMQDKMVAAGVVPAPAAPTPAPVPPRREFALINPVLSGKSAAVAEAKEVPERTFDFVHHDYVERRKNRDGVEYERRTLIYERYTYKNGRLEAYTYSDPRLGLTAEEREVMFGSARPQRRKE